MATPDELDPTLPSDGSPNPRDEPRQTSRRLIGRYEVRHEIGKSEHAVAYDAHDPELHRDVIVQVLAKPKDQREALLEHVRAMAKLRHPALVPVFDVGLAEDRIFIVAPHVRGTSFRDYATVRSLSWRDVLARLLRAGEGLAAAHSVGVAHGDLSKDAIVIADDDVVVTSFSFGDHATPEADQQAFRDVLRAAIETKDAPDWLSAALDRSWSSIGELTHHLEARLRRRRRVILGSGGVIIAGLGVATLAIGLPHKTPDACPDPRRRLVGVWDTDLRDATAAGFKAAAPAIADGALGRLLPRLDSYAEHWRTTQIAMCRAAHGSHAQADLFDRRQVCLDRRLDALRSSVASLARQPSAAVVVRADEAVSVLPDIGDCTRDETLLELPPRPADPVLRARIDAAERELDEIYAMRMRGDMKAGLERVRAAVDAARTLGYGPLLARALYIRSQYEVDSRIESEATLREAARVAAEAHVDRLTAQAWIRLMNHLAAGSRAVEGLALVPVAEAAVVRAGATPDLSYEFHLAAGGAAMMNDKLEAAAEHFDSAQRYASDERRRAQAALYRARVTLLRRGPAAAIPLGEDALRAMEKAEGLNHPLVADALDMLAQATTITGEFDVAAEYARREIRILEGVYGPYHPAISPPLRVLTHVATVRGRSSEARDLATRAVSIAERAGDEGKLATAVFSLAQATSAADGFGAAKPHYARAFATVEKLRGRNHQQYVSLENEYADELVDNGLCTEAAALIEHSIVFFEKKRPELTAMPLYNRARCNETAGKTAGALADYERANTLCRTATCEPAIALSTAASLGRMLIKTGRDKARGTTLLNEAREGFESKGMTDFAAETDRTMKALGIKRR